MQHRQLPENWALDLPEFPADPKGLATRESLAKVLNAAAKNIPWLIGGSADLGPSSKTRLVFDDAGDFSSQNYAGRNFHFAIREHAMGAILNGLSLVKVRPFGSGFFIFTDYYARCYAPECLDGVARLLAPTSKRSWMPYTRANVLKPLCALKMCTEVSLTRKCS